MTFSKETDALKYRLEQLNASIQGLLTRHYDSDAMRNAVLNLCAQAEHLHDTISAQLGKLKAEELPTVKLAIGEAELCIEAAETLLH